MATVSDSVLANVTTALKGRGMWSNTLVVHLSDNGGPVAANAGASHANNWPLRGGKHSKCGLSLLCIFGVSTTVCFSPGLREALCPALLSWEGGIRVVAFASGGLIKPSRHGVVLHGIMHNADWYLPCSNQWFCLGVWAAVSVLTQTCSSEQVSDAVEARGCAPGRPLSTGSHGHPSSGWF